MSAQTYARWSLLPESSTLADGQLMLGGRKATCDGRATVLNPHLDDVAAAYKDFIVLNPDRVAKLPAGVQLWAYAHECGHIRFGNDEARSDCAAVEDGVRAGWLDEAGLDQVCNFIGSARRDQAHAAGAMRCQAMRQCFAHARQGMP